MATHSPPPGFGAPRQQSPPQHQQQQVNNKIKRSKDRRVSWATGEKLCQVRLFIQEDAPTMSGAIQDQLQAKQTRNLHIYNSTVPSSSPDAPPGFGGVAVKPKPDYIALAAIVAQIPLDPTWHVVAGGDSTEIGVQSKREVRMLEAVYPRPSSIPESPAEPAEPQEPYDDSRTAQIPLVPIDEEDPDGADSSKHQSSPDFLGHGAPGQVIGPQTISANAGLANSKPENVKQYLGDHPQPMQENTRTESAWRNPAVVTSARPISSDSINGRISTAGPPIPPIHTLGKPNGVEPDVPAAAAAAIAALRKPTEMMSSMIDNELLIQILSNPSLLDNLTSKHPPFTNLKSDLSTGLPSNGVPRLPDKAIQAQAINVNSNPSGENHWITPPSTSYMPLSLGAQGGNRLNNAEAYSSSGERLLRNGGLDERSSTSRPGPGSAGAGQLYNITDKVNGRVVVPGTLPRPSNAIHSDPPPGFGGGGAIANVLPSAGFSSKSRTSQQGAQALVSAQTSARPLSRLDEQYYKNLIMQHGFAAGDDDHGRMVIDRNKGTIGLSKSSNASHANNTSEAAARWYGREELDGAKPERSGRERRDAVDRNGPGNVPENTGRVKSRKLCIYFGTARGCRNGDKCAFIHELPPESDKGKPERVRSSAATLPYAKRLKVDG